MRTIGIDIGSFSIKVAEVEGTAGGQMRFREYWEVELNHDPGADVRFEKVEALRKIVSQFDLKNTLITVGLSAEYTTTRVLEFPFLERRKILQSLPFELEDSIPFSQEDAIFDFRILSKNQNTSQVLAVVAPKKHIKDLLLLCDDAGFDPDIVSLDSVAYSNALMQHIGRSLSPADAETGVHVAEVFIHVGYKKTLLNVVKSGAVVLSRAIYFGGYDLANAVARTYDLPFMDALKGVTEKGFVLTSKEGADEAQITFSETLAGPLNQMLSDVNRTLVDLKAEMKLQYTHCTVTGGLCNIINLANYVNQELKIETSVRENILDHIQTDTSLSAGKIKVAPVAVGLAIETIRKPNSPAINFRKNEFAKESTSLSHFFERNKTLIWASVSLLIVFYIYTFVRGSFVEDNIVAVDQVISDQAKSNNVGFTKAQTKPEAMAKFIRQKQSELDSQKEISKLSKMASALDVVKSLSSAVPSKDQIKLDVTYVKVEGDRVSMEGTVTTEAEFNQLQKRWSQIPSVSGLKLGPAPKGDVGKYFFQVSMNYKRNSARGGR